MNKELEEIREKYKDDKGLMRRLDIIEKKLKVLEIIKNNLCGKLVFKWYKLGNVGSVELHREDGFVMTILTIDTQEEYNLLREVLL